MLEVGFAPGALLELIAPGADTVFFGKGSSPLKHWTDGPTG
jgi:hypothetical protein